MFVYSIKASTLKFFGIICVALVTLIVLIAFIEPYEPVSAAGNDSVAAEIKYDKIKNTEDVKSFLSQFGWSGGTDAVEK